MSPYELLVQPFVEFGFMRRALVACSALALRLDWESAEELIGAVLRRVHQRDPTRRVKSRVEPGLPLLRCAA